MSDRRVGSRSIAPGWPVASHPTESKRPIMRRFRVSIAGLLAGIALFGVGFAALLHPAPLWRNGLFSITMATLTIAVLAAIYRRGPRRAFWVGFATCGWVYFLAIWGPAPVSNIGVHLVTRAILDIVYPFTLPAAGGQAASSPIDPVDSPPRLARTRAGGSIIFAGAFGGGGPPAPAQTAWQVWTTPDRSMRNSIQGSPQDFSQIGESLFCLVIATAGGVLTRFLHQTNHEPAPPA